MNSIIVASAVLAVVSFKDAAKIKSWDAWNDHKAKNAITNVLQKEKPCAGGFHCGRVAGPPVALKTCK